MNDELKAQGRAFDEFAQEVESTRDRMHNAVAVMNKMLKNKDRGKFCIIIFLTIVLFILMCAAPQPGSTTPSVRRLCNSNPNLLSSSLKAVAARQVCGLLVRRRP